MKNLVDTTTVNRISENRRFIVLYTFFVNYLGYNSITNLKSNSLFCEVVEKVRWHLYHLKNLNVSVLKKIVYWEIIT